MKLRPVRRLWPRKVRARLTLIYAGVDSGLQAQRSDALRNLLVISLFGLGVMTVTSGGLDVAVVILRRPAETGSARTGPSTGTCQCAPR